MSVVLLNNVSALGQATLYKFSWHFVRFFILK